MVLLPVVVFLPTVTLLYIMMNRGLSPLLFHGVPQMLITAIRVVLIQMDMLIILAIVHPSLCQETKIHTIQYDAGVMRMRMRMELFLAM